MTKKMLRKKAQFIIEISKITYAQQLVNILLFSRKTRPRRFNGQISAGSFSCNDCVLLFPVFFGTALFNLISVSCVITPNSPLLGIRAKNSQERLHEK